MMLAAVGILFVIMALTGLIFVFLSWDFRYDVEKEMRFGCIGYGLLYLSLIVGGIFAVLLAYFG